MEDSLKAVDQEVQQKRFLAWFALIGAVLSWRMILLETVKLFTQGDHVVYTMTGPEMFWSNVLAILLVVLVVITTLSSIALFYQLDIAKMKRCRLEVEGEYIEQSAAVRAPTTAS